MIKIWKSLCLIASVFGLLHAADVAKSPFATAKKTSGERKIVAALQTGAYSADSTIVRKILDTNGLSNLPVSYVSDSAHGRITSLTIEETILSSLPADIGNLAALKYLDLNGDGLTSLPKEIGNLMNLCSLSVEGNSLSELPGSIAQLASLRFLDLKNNKLSDLPGDIIVLNIPPETTWVMVPCPAACPFAKELVSKLLLAGNLLCTLPDSVKGWVMDYAPGDLQLQTCNNGVQNISTVQSSNLFTVTQVQDFLLISYTSLQGENLKLQVFALNGRLIKTEELHAGAGRFSYALSKSFLAKGMNIIQISGRNSRYLMRSIVE